jgi:hypothetical protein
MSESKDLVSFEDKMKEMATQQASVEASGSNYISLRGGVMTFMDQALPNNELFAIILGASGEHSYYDQAYDPDRIIPPRCFSVFKLDDEPVPHENVPEEQQESDLCKNCWAHKFKSADNGRGRACSVRRRLAVMAADGLDDPENADIALMKLPPTSVANWSKYINKLSAQYQRPNFMVVTRIFVEPHPKFQFTVGFEAKELIDVENFEKLNAMHESVDSLLLAPLDMTEPDEEEPVKELKGGRKKKTSKK